MMTPERLAEIEARANAAIRYEPNGWIGPLDYLPFAQFARGTMSDLVAEVRRLRARNSELEREIDKWHEVTSGDCPT